MEEKKLTDEEIVKALECCTVDELTDCENCPLLRESCAIIRKYALDLIHRQKAEIERLTEENGRISQSYIEVCDINAKLTEENRQLKMALARADLQVQFQIGEADVANKTSEELQKQVDELTEENERLNNCIMSEEQVRKCCADIIQETMNKAAKDTTKEILTELLDFVNSWFEGIENNDFGVEFNMILKNIAEKFGVDYNNLLSAFR